MKVFRINPELIKIQHQNAEFNTVNLEIIAIILFSRNSHMLSFVKIKSSRNAEITQSFNDIGKSCPSREFLASQICLLALFAKIKFYRKFPDL